MICRLADRAPDRQGRGQPQRAGAGDQADGQPGHQPLSQRAEGPVQQEGQDGDACHNRQEPGRDPVHQALIASLGESRLLDQLHQPGERSVGPRGIDPHDQITVEIERPAQDPRPLLLEHGPALARQDLFVHQGGVAFHLPVGGKPFARQDPQPVADLDFRERDELLMFRARAQPADVEGQQPGESIERRGRLQPAGRLEPAAQRGHHQDHAADLEVDRACPPEHREQRRGECGTHSQAEQCVGRQDTPAQVLPGAACQRDAQKEKHR